MRGAAALQVLGRVVDLARVQDAVATATDVDERRLHAGKHVLHATQVDVAHHRSGPGAGDVVLDQHVFLEHRDLVAVAVLGDDHELVGHTRRRWLWLPASPTLASRAAPRGADPAGRAAGGYLLLDRLRLRGSGAGRLWRSRLGRGRRTGRGFGGALRVVGAARRGAPATSRGRLRDRGRIRVRFSLVPLGVDRIDHRRVVGLGVGVGRSGPGRLPASAAAAPTAPALLGWGRRAISWGRRLRRLRAVVGDGGLRRARRLRRIPGRRRGRRGCGGLPSPGLPGPLR